MTVVAWVFALLAALIHIVVFTWESLLIRRRGVHEGIFSVPAEDLPAIRLWSFGLGFYNLFLGLGLVAGVVAWASGEETVGRTLLVYICSFLVLCGVVLLVADRLGYSHRRGSQVMGAVSQGIPPLVALVATLW